MPQQGHQNPPKPAPSSPSISRPGGPPEAAEIERVLRAYNGTVPDDQLISEASLALAIFRPANNRHQQTTPVGAGAPNVELKCPLRKSLPLGGFPSVLVRELFTPYPL